MSQVVNRCVIVMLALVAAVAMTGCNSFDKRWEAAAATPDPTNDITGRWQGTWVSEASGHTGDLRAIITRADDGSYQTDYHATYGETFKFSFGMGVTFRPEVRDGRWYFGGEHDLGFPFGSYKYTGTATPTEFHADYSTKDDHGTYKMSRPSSAPAAAK